MPNWCDNDLYITGKRRKEALDSLKTDKEAVDFNKVIPMPAILEETVSGSGYSDEQALKNRTAHFITGYSSWFDWSVDKWGTKWNASESRVLPNKTRRKKRCVAVNFETAWSPPTPVLIELSKKFPDCIFEMDSFERGMEYHRTTACKNGEILFDKVKPYFGSRGG